MLHVNKRRVLVSVLGVGAIAMTVVAFATASSETRRSPATAGAVPTSAELTTVQGAVQQWLASAGFKGFRVAEVMAFTNNDYVAVDGRNGKPAFELIIAPDLSWLMEEPASMMWNTRYGMLHGTSTTYEPVPGLSMMWGGGMMGGSSGMMGSPLSWYSRGTGKVTSLAQAVTVADAWLTKTDSGQKAESDGRAFPGYYTLDTTLDGKTHGMISVNATTGTVWYHGWHGAFLAEKQF
jgi:hypothetical protein